MDTFPGNEVREGGCGGAAPTHGLPGSGFQPIQLFVKQQREEIMDLEDC